MDINRPKQRKKEQLIQAILDAAEELILEQGYANLRMRKIARKINYSATAIYKYFSNKSEIVYHIMQNIFTQMVTEYRAVLSEDIPDPVRRLKKVLKISIKYAVDNPSHYKMALLFDMSQLEEHGENETSLQPFYIIVELVEQCIKEGYIINKDPVIIAQGFYATVHGITSLLILRRDFPWKDKEALIEHILDTQINGLRSS